MDACPPSRLPRHLVRLSWLFAMAPFLLLLALLSHALHIRAVLAHWPVVYRDSPETTLLSIHEWALLWPALYLTLLSVPAWALLGVVPAALGVTPRRALALQAGALIFGAPLLAAVFRFDTTGYVEWFLD